MRKLLIATGGTGGHIYPALALAEEARSRGAEVCFIGSLGQAEEKIKARGFCSVSLRVKGFVAKSLWQKAAALAGLLGALFVSARAIWSFRPDAVVGFGGYSSFPAVLMARLLGRTAVVHEQNVVPGLANKVLSPVVQRVCVGFRDSLGYFSEGKAVWTGTPFRVSQAPINRDQAARAFGLDPAGKIVLVFGGSQGSKRINDCFLEVLQLCAWAKEWQIIHSTGKTELESTRLKYSALRNPSHVRAFIENIDVAYAACDLVVARAGAGTVTELGLLGVPAVLIPYPGANDHQLMNARVLARAGSAVIIEENSLSSDILGANILAMSKLNASRRDFQETLSEEFIPDPARRLADEVERLLTVS